MTTHLLRALPDVPTTIIDGPPPIAAPTSQAALMTASKKQLYLTAQRGPFVRDCPGATSRNVESQLCCGYMIVDIIANCNYDCTYCYLQGYVNTPYLTIYANVERLFDELATLLRARAPQRLRIGSGEFSDSLSLDPLTGFSKLLVPFLRQFPNVLFELRTKSDLVDNLLGLDPQGRVMVSWSVNPEPVVQREEHKTASLAERLYAAQRCRDAGYAIGLHFDPLLHYPGWEADYEPFVAQVFRALAPDDIAYISMGSLRFAPALKSVVQQRFAKSKIMTAELLPGTDGKMRYFRPLRVDMYTKMLAWLRRYTAESQCYLCMENPAVWHKVFDQVPSCNAAMEQRIQAAEFQTSPAVSTLIPVESLVSR
jgi:spore photoproduct lyase